MWFSPCRWLLRRGRLALHCGNGHVRWICRRLIYSWGMLMPHWYPLSLDALFLFFYFLWRLLFIGNIISTRLKSYHHIVCSTTAAAWSYYYTATVSNYQALATQFTFCSILEYVWDLGIGRKLSQSRKRSLWELRTRWFWKKGSERGNE